MTGPGIWLCCLFFAASVSGQSGRKIPDTVRIQRWLDQGSDYLFRPGSVQKDIDSSLFFFNQALDLSRSIHHKAWENAALKLKGDSYLEAANLYDGEACFMEVIRYYQRTKDIKNEAWAWDRLAECIQMGNQAFSAEKIRCYYRALTLYHQLRDTLAECTVLRGISYTYFHEGELDEAEKIIIDVISRLEARQYPHMVNSYDLLADIYKYKGAFRKELLYRLKGIESLDLAPANPWAGTFYSKMAQTYMELGIFEKGDLFYKKALLECKIHNQSEFFDILLLHVKSLIIEKRSGMTLAFLKQATKEFPPIGFDQRLPSLLAFANCYNALHEFKKAELYYLQAIDIAQNRYDHQILSTVNYVKYLEEVAAFYISIKEYKKSNYYIHTLRALPAGVVSQASSSKIHLMQFKIDSAAGSYLSAIRHFEDHKILDDSALSAEKSKQIAELEIQYETEKKDKEIQLKINHIQSLEKNSQLQNSRIRQEKMIRNMVIGGAIGLMLLLGITYNRYKLKQKNNLLLQLQQREINQQNQVLQKLNSEQTTLIKEKEWLLREIHHRVKNNLQITMSLLNMQSVYLDNQQALEAIRDSQRRMHSMSLIHQKLYRADNLAYIDMADYIPELVSFLRDSFADEKGIQFELQIVAVKLNVAHAVPLGLILNEAIANAIKYAFPGNRKGRILISLEKDAADINILTIRDDGVGLPEDLNPHSSSTLGLSLIKGLTEQILGECMIESKEGTIVTIRFKDLQLTPEEFSIVKYVRAV